MEWTPLRWYLFRFAYIHYDIAVWDPAISANLIIYKFNSTIIKFSLADRTQDMTWELYQCSDDIYPNMKWIRNNKYAWKKNNQ